MNVRVISAFHDKHSYSKVYHVGLEVEFEDSRASDLVARGLVEPVTDTDESVTDDGAPSAEESVEVAGDAGCEESSDDEPEAEQSESEDDEKTVKPRRGRKSKYD